MSQQGPSSPEGQAEIVALKAMIAERDAALLERDAIILARDEELIELHAQLTAAHADNALRDLVIEKLKASVARYRRMTFGRSSERLDQLELMLEELETEKAASIADAAVPDHVRATADRSFSPHLPRKKIVREPQGGGCVCPQCGDPLRSLGDDADEMLDIIPQLWRVLRVVRPKYSCRACDTIVQAPAPAKAVARCKASFATLAHIAVAKFDHHLPFYRQVEMMAAMGIDIDRSTLARWMGHVTNLLDPIFNRIRQISLATHKIHVDDTPVPMLDPGRGRTATARLWTYAVDDRASGSQAPPMVWYRFTPDRSGDHPARELAEFTGYLQADAFSGYKQLYRSNRVTEVACWGHFRRKIFDIHENKPTALTADLLARIAALYRIEDDVRGQPPDVRRAARQTRTTPLVSELREVLLATQRRLSPRSEMGKAIAYGTKLWVALTRFLDHGELEIDNLIAERSLRGIAIGRRNWLFAGSKIGGERAATIYSVIETCRLNGVEPEAYIADIIEKIASDWPASRWDELMPWNWTSVGAPDVAAAA